MTPEALERIRQEKELEWERRMECEIESGVFIR